MLGRAGFKRTPVCYFIQSSQLDPSVTMWIQKSARQNDKSNVDKLDHFSADLNTMSTAY